MLRLRAQIDELKQQDRSLGRRNRYLGWVLLGGVVLLLVVLAGLYQFAVRSYAVLDQVAIRQDQANQGMLEVSFRVVSPGVVHYRRTSGKSEAELLEVFRSPGTYTRSWSWLYEPGSPIETSLCFRGPFWRKTQTTAFPTSRRADIVVLIDTTGSMGRYINQLKDRCSLFAQRLNEQEIQYRFALLGFGDVNEGEWLDQYPFTSDVGELKANVARVRRFDGGDYPESALDALEEAMQLPFEKVSLRRFYLVTDDTYHPRTRSGATVEQLAQRLREANILLTVFTTAEFFPDYEKLLTRPGNQPGKGEGGNVRLMEVERFGHVLSEGRLLED
jgi:hypothetical protein